MKDYRIAEIMAGHSEYDHEVWELLSAEKLQYQDYFSEFDHLDIADCFIVAGADVKTPILEGEDVRIEIFIDPGDMAGFMRRLKDAIQEKYASL